MKAFSISKGEGCLRVTMDVTVFDGNNGVVAVLHGGELPHVGGMALATPGPMLHGRQLSRVDVWTSTVPGHKDVHVASSVARELCLAVCQPVSVTAGIHVDDATPDQIAVLSQTCFELARDAGANICQKGRDPF